MGTESMSPSQLITTFNGAVEVGLRSLAILNEAYPSSYSLQKLVIFDYFAVHSDDIPNFSGPAGLHPQTPNRGSELLVRRDTLQQGLLLYQSRGLIETRFEVDGLYFIATDRSGSFLDALEAEYLTAFRFRADWVVERFGTLPDDELSEIVRRYIGIWGAEFEWSSILWGEEGI